jgi:hypothetical protein
MYRFSPNLVWAWRHCALTSHILIFLNSNNMADTRTCDVWVTLASLTEVTLVYGHRPLLKFLKACNASRILLGRPERYSVGNMAQMGG